jgi:type III pantothenate kinase
MKPNLVVDVGNSRIKWGYCAEDRVVHKASLPPDDPVSWEHQIKQWEVRAEQQWAVASVHPERGGRFAEWVKQRGDQVSLIQQPEKLPIKINVREPYRVGIDRLLNAVAAKSRVQRRASIFIIDAGSAVTVDWVDEEGTFRGGAILPGFRMMAKALHEHSAALPLVAIESVPQDEWPRLPGTFTEAAIRAGIFWAVAGGIKAILWQLVGRAKASRHHVTYLTGGDALFIAPVLDSEVQYWREMTLEGVRLAAEALP